MEGMSSEEHVPEIGKQLLKWLKILTGATALLYILVIVAIVVVAVFTFQTHDALCHVRDDRQQQVNTSRHYLNTHTDEDLAKFGFTRAQVLQQIAQEEQTVKALNSLWGC